MKKLISALGALAVITSVLTADVINVSENEAYVTVKAAVTSENTDLSATAIEKMNDLEKIRVSLSGFLKYDSDESIQSESGNYFLVNDPSFTTAADFKKLIENTCTGDLKDSFLKQTEWIFIEKDGKTYVHEGGKGAEGFDTGKGVTIIQASETSFSAVTNEFNYVNGATRAKFVLEDGNWLIKEYDFDIFGNITDKEALSSAARVKMREVQRLMAIFAGNVERDENVTITIDGETYEKVTENYSFNSIQDIKERIDEVSTGELRKWLNDNCDYEFVEKDGELYKRYGARGSVIFNLDEGVTITDIINGTYTATTIGSNDLFGYGRISMKLSDDDRWCVESFEYGEFGNEEESKEHPPVRIPAETTVTTEVTTAAITSESTQSVTEATQAVSSEPTPTVTEASQTVTSAAPVSTEASQTAAEVTAEPAKTENAVTEQKKYTAEQIRDMAIVHYEKKTGKHPASAYVTENVHGVVTVALQDENGETLDVYTINPVNGIGECNNGNCIVDLPLTGNNSPKKLGAAAAALALTAAGAFAAFKSGVLKRK